MKKFITDLHLYAPNETDCRPFDLDAYLLGDIYDLMNCKKSDVDKVKLKISLLRNLFGWRYLQDNHDAIDRKVSNPIRIPGSDIAICGGSEIFWDEDRLHNYTKKEFGAGFFKRQIWVRALMMASKFVSDKISDKAMNRAVSIALKNGATKVVCGHKHPKKLLTRTQEGITLYVLPRGLTRLDI